MGKSTWGSSTMRTSLISFGFLLLVPAILADSFAGEKVKVGKKTCTCDFTFVLNGDKVNVKSSLVACDKKCSGAAKNVELGGDGMNFYVVSFAVKKGKGKLQKATVELAGATTMPFGSGGSGTGMPTMPGSGSGFPGTGSGSGYGSECAPGFLKVCPEIDYTCPYDSMPVCPAPMTMPMGRSFDRMMDTMGSDDGCECVPMVLMQMVMTQQEVVGRSLDRAGGDSFEDESVKVGKKTCTCDFEFTVAGNGKARGTGACDKKCSGNVKEMTLNGYEYSYTFGFSVKKGKVKVGKVTAVGGSTGGTTTGMPGGSGMPGGGYGHSGCVCVHMPSDMGTGYGSGMPPTGSGSGYPGSGTGSSDCTCGIAQRSTRIVGGQEVEVNEWPWQAGMVWSGSSSVFCGATVISDEWILTASHCVDGTAASEIQMLLGEHDYWDSDEPVRMDISEIIMHPDYNSNTVDQDFALLRMANPIDWAANPNTRPACLPEYTAGDYDQWMSTVTGWGTTSSGGPTSNVLLEVDVKVISNSECNAAYGGITSNMLCAADASGNGGSDACQGDSGGPLVACGMDGNCGTNPGQNYELIGVVSFGIGCAEKDFPGVYARTTAALDWIYTNAMPFETCYRY